MQWKGNALAGETGYLNLRITTTTEIPLLKGGLQSQFWLTRGFKFKKKIPLQCHLITATDNSHYQSLSYDPFNLACAISNCLAQSQRKPWWQLTCIVLHCWHKLGCTRQKIFGLIHDAQTSPHLAPMSWPWANIFPSGPKISQ